jgi:formylglycine-generating enzyme required for sulfatase activity
MIEIEMVNIPAGGGVEAFSIGKYPVMVAQWNAVMPDDPRQGDDQHPVTKVNIPDIQVFLSRLNKEAGKQYRLPTDREWCWAAGLEPQNLAEYAVFNADKIAPVGSKLPNEYGVFDMRGNVWEWSANAKGTKYTLRGGSWALNDVLARAVSRYNLSPAIRGGSLGFRLYCCVRPLSA